MAIVAFTGWEDNTASEVVGTVNTDAVTVRSGLLSVISNPVTTATGSLALFGKDAAGASVTVSVATSYIQFWFRYAIKPASNYERMFTVLTSGNAPKIYANLKSDGTIELRNLSATILGTSSTVLSQDTWYKIEITCGTSATVGAYELKINGNSEFSGTTNTSATNAGKYVVGKYVNVNGNTVEFYYDDLIVSDSAYVSGDVSILAINPTANGSTMSWTGGTGASDYTQVDEGDAVSDADYVQSPTTGNPNVALFDMTDSATAGISGTIISVLAEIRVRENTSVTSSNFLRVRSGSTNSDNTAVNLTTSVSSRGKYLSTDPDTSTAWTTSGIDGIEIGAVESNAVAVRLTWVMAQVAFVPPDVANSNFLQFFGPQPQQ